MSGGRTLHGAFGSPIGSTLDVNAALLIDFLVAENTVGAVVGTVGLERYGQNALLRSLAVGSTLRNAGLGARLLFPAELTVRSLAVTKLRLVTTRAGQFFQRMGYTEAQRNGASD